MRRPAAGAAAGRGRGGASLKPLTPSAYEA